VVVRRIVKAKRPVEVWTPVVAKKPAEGGDMVARRKVVAKSWRLALARKSVGNEHLRWPGDSGPDGGQEASGSQETSGCTYVLYLYVVRTRQSLVIVV
jgi:hypothetical protein